MWLKKKIWLRIQEKDNISSTEIAEMIRKIQEENPTHEVFYDGDEQAICSIDMKDMEELQQELKKKKKRQRTLLDSF